MNQETEQSTVTGTEREPVWTLSKKMLLTCDPKTLDKKYLKDFNMKLQNTTILLNQAELNPDSPRTYHALELCEIHPSQIYIQSKDFLKNPNEGIDLIDKRYLIYLYQVSLLRKQVIIQRNKLKRETQQEKKIEPSKHDQSMSSEYTVYKSPTEMIESWVEQQQVKSSKYENKILEIQKVLTIQQKKLEVAYLDQQSESEKFKEKQNQDIEKKAKNRQMKLQEKKRVAKKYNSKSMEISQRMKQQYELFLKQSLLKKKETDKHFEEIHEKLEQEKYKKIEEQEQKALKYEEKLQKAQSRKQQFESQINLRERHISTERSRNSPKQLRLPQLRKYMDPERLYSSNVEHCFKVMLKKSNSISQYTQKDESTILKLQELQEKQEQNKKELQEIMKNRVLKVQERLQKKDEHLQEVLLKKEQDLQLKIEKKRDLMLKNEMKFSQIKEEYNQKCNAQMEKETTKFKSNVQLLKYRDQAIGQIVYIVLYSSNKKFLEKSKSLVSLNSSVITKQ